MGVMQHHAIVATTWSDEVFIDMLDWIKNRTEEERQLFKFGEGWVNGYSTVVMIPDGSKAGWGTSDDGDDLRDRFIKRIGKHNWDWVEVTYGEMGHRITRKDEVGDN